MKFNKYLPFALLYFFFNSVGLPFGLTYTAMLSPFFYWWVLKERKQEVLIPYLVVFAPIVLIHFLFVGVHEQAYLVSFINLTAIYIFCQAVYTFLKRCYDVRKIFNWILVLNFFLCLIACALYFTTYYYLFWIQQFLTEGIDNFKRLKLFTYEASYYATLLIPIFFFYFFQILLRQNRINAWLLLPMLLLPFILSFSLGVMSIMLISIVICLLFYFKPLIRKRRVVNIVTLVLVGVIPTIMILYLFYPGNPLFSRLQNVFKGEDSSGRGRTFEAFYLANQLIQQKSAAWGIGFGQIKIVGADLIRNFYLYPVAYPVVAIPNATAETLAIFGWVGLIIRFFIQILLFFYTKVWTSYYRMALFLFVFFYQFTGSFVTNISEYVIWIFAFTEIFAEFQVNPKPGYQVQTSSNSSLKAVNE